MALHANRQPPKLIAYSYELGSTRPRHAVAILDDGIFQTRMI